MVTVAGNLNETKNEMQGMHNIQYNVTYYLVNHNHFIRNNFFIIR